MKRRLFNFRSLAVLTAMCVVLAAIFLTIGGTPQKAQDEDIKPSAFEKFSQPDVITGAIRDRSNGLMRVLTATQAEKDKAATLGTIVHDYGLFVIVAGRKGLNLSGVKNAQLMETSINLPNGKFEALDAARPEEVRPGTGAKAPGKGYYIVQFGTSATDELLQSLKDAGMEVLQYVPHQAFFVYGDGEAASKVAAHSRVRWIGAFTPDEKISGVLSEQLSAARGSTAPRGGISPLELTAENKAIFDVAIFARAELSAFGAAAADLTAGSIKNFIPLPNNFFNVVRMEIPLDQVERIAQMPDVIRIDSWSKPSVEDERAAMIVAGNYTGTTTISGPGYNPLTQFGVDGTRVTISMVDDGVSIPGNGGFYVTSTNTVDGPLRGSTAGASGGHGHINASIIAGNTPFGIQDPLGYNYGLGIAPKSNIINIPMLKAGYTGTEGNAYADTVITPGPNGWAGSISNNSWGNGTNSNVYDAYTAQFDGFVRDASVAATIDPITLVFSAGNSGPGALSLTRPKAAKNIIAVGNSENLRTELSASANNMDDLTSSSSRGPSADGRVKPDITAPGTVITGSRAGSCGSVSSCFDANHAWSSGTSHAAPQVAGAAALFTNWWMNGHSFQGPSPALIKAAVILSGQEMNGVNTGAVIPNGNEGWGRINMKLMLDPATSRRYVNQETTFGGAGLTKDYYNVVADSTKPLRVTLVWTDPPAAADPALVNNLDLTVTVGSTVYRGNVFASGVSTTGGSADTLNNVENVWLPAGTAAGTTVKVQVAATAINGDGDLGNGDATDQHFALVISNVTAEKPSDFDGDGKSDVAVWRNTDGGWYATKSSDNSFLGFAFGTNGDIITPGDYDGDGKADFAVFRNGAWYLQRSTLGFFATNFGLATDIPAQGDFDGDGKTDIAVFRPSNGTWYIQRSTEGLYQLPFGTSGDKPAMGDYDGDGRTDIAVYRPSNGTWYLFQSTVGYTQLNFGIGVDKIAPADYDGDGKTDIAVFRPSDGAWYILKSKDGFYALAFGSNGDIPAPGDFDGDGKADISVFRPSVGDWYQMRSTSGFFGVHFGANGDKPVPSGYASPQ